MVNSTGLIGRVRERYKELERKGWDWRSFYNGWLEGRADLMRSRGKCECGGNLKYKFTSIHLKCEECGNTYTDDL